MKKINYYGIASLEDVINLRKQIESVICKNHNGKMEGFWSMSTSVILNEFCQKRKQCEECICSKCYAAAQLNRYKNQAQKQERAHKLLTESVLPVEAWPKINVLKFRFEAFGDLATVEQVINYFNFCLANPRTTFSIWTKNPFLIEEAIKAGFSKPKNLIVIYSSPRINKFANPKYDFIDKIFTVYTADFAIENNININCGSRNCLECGRCYDLSNGEKFVNEMLKQEQTKYYKMLSEKGDN